MQLKGRKIRDLYEALAIHFTKSDLENLLLAIDRQLGRIVGEGGMDEVAKRVVLEAQRNGWIVALIQQAVKERPQVSELKQLCAELCTQAGAGPGNAENPYQAWRLLGGQLFADRAPLRQSIERELSREFGKPILVVDGPCKSGKTHSLMFINHLQSSLKNFDIIWLDLADMMLEKPIPPEEIGQSIVTQMGLEGMPSRQNEQDSTWGRRFCDWLSAKTADLDQTYWIVIDHCDKVLLTQGARDLLVHLTHYIPIKLKPHRLVLLGYPNWETLPALAKNYAIRETMRLLNQDELEAFFGMLYQEQQQQHNRPFTSKDIKKSVRTVWNKRKACLNSQENCNPQENCEKFWEALQQGANKVLYSEG